MMMCSQVSHELRSILAESEDAIRTHLHAQWPLVACIRRETGGHNSRISIIDFTTTTGQSVGTVCVKCALATENQAGLSMEAQFLRQLYLHGIACPRVIAAGGTDHPFVVMQVMEGWLASECRLTGQSVRQVLGLIHLHETALMAGLHTMEAIAFADRLDKPVDYAGKLSKLLSQHLPHVSLDFRGRELGFLNECLNRRTALRERTIVTDRSAGNILCDEREGFAFIDFSTARIGSRFDNVIQFIDDPRAGFSCPRDEIMDMVLGDESNNPETAELFHAASIYTNLLQGIFTWKQDRGLATAYLKKVNEAYARLHGRGDALIGING